MFTALDERIATVPGPEAAALSVPTLAGSLTTFLNQRRPQAGRIEEHLHAHPRSKVLASNPGVGVRTGTRILIGAGDGGTFPTAGHLAAHAGLAPAPRSFGSSIRDEQPSRRETAQTAPSMRRSPGTTRRRSWTTRSRRSPRASKLCRTRGRHQAHDLASALRRRRQRPRRTDLPRDCPY
ncbi:transposase [Streptomyces sp. NPDC088748]|uniref:transposase n=1 Tax=Streptomyces sp. NPDC088748 TaxID=3365887 RepID=UPI00382FAF21